MTDITKEKTVVAVFEEGQKTAITKDIYQYDHGLTLEIRGLDLPAVCEVHFALCEDMGSAIRREAMTVDRVTRVLIPNSLIWAEKCRDFRIFAFVYVTDEEFGKTVKKIKTGVKTRPKPDGEDKPIEPDEFEEITEALKKIAEEAIAAEKSAEGWAHGSDEYPEREEDNAKHYADQAQKASINASLSASTAKTFSDQATKTKAEVEELKREANESAEKADISEEEAKKAAQNARTSAQESAASAQAAGTSAQSASGYAQAAAGSTQRAAEEAEKAKSNALEAAREKTEAEMAAGAAATAARYASGSAEEAAASAAEASEAAEKTEKDVTELGRKIDKEITERTEGQQALEDRVEDLEKGDTHGVDEVARAEITKLQQADSVLSESIIEISDVLFLKGLDKNLSDLEEGKFYSGSVGQQLTETSNANSIFIKLDVGKWRDRTITITLNQLITGSRCIGFCDGNNKISLIHNQHTFNSNATLNQITGLYEVKYKITDDVFFFSYSKLASLTIKVDDVQNIYDKKEADAKITDVSCNPKFAHFSFDDVVFCMQDITQNASAYSSIFENPFFAKLKEVHDKYGTKYSLYLFTENISSYTNKFSTEFAKCSDWLKFGLHINQKTASSYSATTAEQARSDYNNFVNEIYRITGTFDSIDKCPRLSNFMGNLDSCIAMRDANAGVVGFLTAYDDRNSYYLDANDSAWVFTHGRLYDYENRLTFFHTYKTIEAQNPITVTFPRMLTAEGNNGSEYLVLMGHEYAFYDKTFHIVDTYINRLDLVSEWANNHGYLWDYPMNRAMR